MVAPKVSKAVPCAPRAGQPGRSRQRKPPWGADGTGAVPGLVTAETGQAGKAEFSHGGTEHDSCPDRAQAQPKRTIIPIYPNRRASPSGPVELLSGQPNIRAPIRVPWGRTRRGAPRAACDTPRPGRTVRGMRGDMHGWDVPIPVVETRRSNLLELLSGRRVKSPEDGSAMTLVGHAGAAGRVVVLLPRGSADPLSNGGGRGGRASRSACPRQRGA
jgi:hypothetical protein